MWPRPAPRPARRPSRDHCRRRSICVTPGGSSATRAPPARAWGRRRRRRRAAGTSSRPTASLRTCNCRSATCGWRPRRPTPYESGPVDVPRGGRHQSEGRPRRRPQVRRRHDERAALHRPALPRRPEGLLRHRRHPQDHELLPARTSPDWRQLAGDDRARSSPASTSTRRGTTPARRRATSTPTPARAGAATPSPSSATRPTVTSCATAGARAGVTKASGTRPRRTPPRPSRRATGFASAESPGGALRSGRTRLWGVWRWRSTRWPTSCGTTPRHGHDHVAIHFEGEDLTYAQLDERSSRVAQGLRALGVGPQDRVTYLGKNLPAFADLCFGAAKLERRRGAGQLAAGPARDRAHRRRCRDPRCSW